MRRDSFSVKALPSSLVLIIAGSSEAHCPKYRVVDLGSLSTSSAASSDAWSINSAGQVVGLSSTNDPQEFHAFYWQNTLGNCRRDLGALAGGHVSIAYDLNNNPNGPEIVGQSEIVIQGTTVVRAAYWSHPLATPADLGTLGSTLEGSAAFAINDISLVVGQTDTDVGCPNDPLIQVVRAFKKQQPGGAMTVLLPAGSFGGLLNQDSATYGISTPPPPPSAGLVPVIAGTGSPCGASPPFCGTPSDTLDLDSSDSVAWGLVSAGPTDLPEPSGFGDGRGEGRDVNTGEELAGWGRQQGSPCLDRALFWHQVSGNVTVRNLHALAAVPANQETRAEAMNNAALVVGQNKTTIRAYKWTPLNPGRTAWSVVDLNNEIEPLCTVDGGLGDWQLREAREINESGWIVGKGVHGSNTRGFLLIPIATCLWDFTGAGGTPDCTVNSVDWLALFQAWGPCDPAKCVCLPDFDCDGTVGQVDLNELNAHWGDCVLYCPPPCPGSAGNSSPGSSFAQVEQALLTVGFTDMQEFASWMDTASATERAAVLAILGALLLP